MDDYLQLDTRRHVSQTLMGWLGERGGGDAFKRAGVQLPVQQAQRVQGGPGDMGHGLPVGLHAAAGHGAAAIGPTWQGQPMVDMMGWQPSATGVRVDESSAMRVSTVYACVGLLAGAVASMPKTFYKRLPEGDPDQVQHPYWWILNERACEEFSAAVFWEYLMCSLLLQGDAFAEILRPSIGSSRVIGLRPLHPQRVTVRRLTSGALYYVVQPVDGTAPYVLDASDMLHVPGLGFNGWRGMSVVRWAAKEAIGLGLATEEYSARFYGNGARPDFVFKTEKSLDKKQREALLETWQGDYRGVGNAHMPAILTGGLGIEKISMSPEDAALIDVRGFQVEDLCRFFGTPPHMVGHTANTTAFGSGMESLGTYFTRYTLGRHVKKIEEEVNAKLWPMRATYFMECDMSGLERGDMSSRFNSYRIALGRAGEQPIMTVNEVRRREKLKPVPGGNELRAAAPAAAGVPGGEPGSKGAGPGGAGGEGGED